MQSSLGNVFVPTFWLFPLWKSELDCLFIEKEKEDNFWSNFKYDIAHSGVSSGIQGKTLIAHGLLGCECSAKAPPIELPSIPLAHPLQTTDFFLPLCDDTVLSLTVPSACKALQYIMAQLYPCYSHLRSRWPWRSVSNHATLQDN